MFAPDTGEPSIWSETDSLPRLLRLREADRAGDSDRQSGVPGLQVSDRADDSGRDFGDWPFCVLALRRLEADYARVAGLAKTDSADGLFAVILAQYSRGLYPDGRFMGGPLAGLRMGNITFVAE